MFLSLPVESERERVGKRELECVYVLEFVVYSLLAFPSFFLFASSISLWWWLRDRKERDETLFELSWETS